MIRKVSLSFELIAIAAIAVCSGCGVEAKNSIAAGTEPSAVSANNPTPEPAVAPAADPSPAQTVQPKSLGNAAPRSQTDGIKLTPAKWNEYLEHVKPKGGKKFTLVDAWATWCAPCKENFPHVVEMHEKYGPKGLQVVSLSMDDLSDAKAVKEATDFLVSQKAVITNLIMNESQEVAFDKLEISAIPSVFLFDAQGKEVHRFTLEDPNDQFTYAQVEQAVEALLEGKPVPKFKKSAAK